jgi:phosphoribosylglycinamide formyltransferase-1
MTMSEEFFDDPITPVEMVVASSAGEPALPRRFRWRDKEYEIAAVLERWKDTGPCHSGSGERYVRKHWFHIATTDGARMKIYFERQARRGGQGRQSRWWLYTAELPQSGQLPC